MVSQFLEGTEGTKSENSRKDKDFFPQKQDGRSQDGRRHPGEILLG